MRYAVISDLHSNLEAIEAVAKDAQAAGAEAFVCLGDIVGYGADPIPLIEWTQQTCAVVVAGNHDQAVIGATDASYFNPVARAAANWTIPQLSSAHTDYLASLPLTGRIGQAFFVHATPFEPERWHYLSHVQDAALSFPCFKESLCFIGHSHLPGVFSYDTRRRGIRPGSSQHIKIEPGRRYIVNVGSVGQPRDRSPHAAYAIFDACKLSVELRRVEYNVALAAEKIIAAGLPPYLADRLHLGQ